MKDHLANNNSNITSYNSLRKNTNQIICGGSNISQHTVNFRQESVS